MNLKVRDKVKALTASNRVMAITSINVRELTAEGPQGVTICCHWQTDKDVWHHENFKPEELQLVQE